MAFAGFNPDGDLPPGIHSASLAEAVDHFGKATNQRALLATRLERVHQLAQETGNLARFVVFGSFVTDKSKPNDVDIFIIMDDNFGVAKLAGESRLLFDHERAQAHFGCSVFWVRRLAALGGEEAAIVHWQIKRNGGRRGIVEITAD